MKRTITAAAAALVLVGLTACAPEAEEEALTEPGSVEVVEEEPVPELDQPVGTRDNPLPVGSEVVGTSWTVTVNGVDLDATEKLAAQNSLNEAPPEGYVHILADLTIEYTGDDPNGAYTEYLINYVTADGNTLELSWVDVGPDEFTTLSEMYPGATHTGWMPFTVPAETAADGVLAITPDMSSDKVFVAVS